MGKITRIQNSKLVDSARLDLHCLNLVDGTAIP